MYRCILDYSTYDDNVNKCYGNNCYKCYVTSRLENINFDLSIHCLYKYIYLHWEGRRMDAVQNTFLSQNQVPVRYSSNYTIANLASTSHAPRDFSSFLLFLIVEHFSLIR